MPFAVEIKCISSDYRLQGHELIEVAWGFNNTSAPWMMSMQDAIAGIESGTWLLFVTAAGRRVWTDIATNPQGIKYLKAVNEEQQNLLLTLPQCPDSEDA